MSEWTTHLGRWAFVLTIVSGACSSTRGHAGHEGGDTATPASLTSLVDGPWRFEADRAWHGQIGRGKSPSAPLAESDYQPVTPTTVYQVVLSEAGRTVTIGTTPLLIGTLAPTSAEHATFDLSKSTFAGGRFVVWPEQARLQAELTIYGSGVPIVSSARGALTPGAP